MGRKWGHYLRLRSGQITLAIAIVPIIVFIAVACSNNTKLDLKHTSPAIPKTSELNIWWEQGYNLDEDEAIRRIVNKWGKQTNKKVNLSFYTSNGLTTKAERALEVGNPPDILMTPRAERILYPRLAWEGKLEDVTDIIQPRENEYPENILKGITYYNAKESRRSYYSVPIYQATMFIFYWRGLLDAVGLTPQDIPQDWNGFWQFWQQAQIKLNQQNKDIYGLGLSLSGNKSANDTHNLFEQILEAYDLSLLDDRGNLKIDSKVYQGIINCLSWYAQLYHQGYVPPDAGRWSNTDNNRNLLNQRILMTPNVSLSIPATVRQDADTYYNQLGVSEFPRKPSGDPMCYLIFIRQAVIFHNSAHKSLAKEFLSYFIQPEVTVEYLKNTGSRNQPVQNSAWLDSYWRDPNDPYISTATKILTTPNIRLSYTVDNPAYSQVLAENVWGKALTQVTVDGISPQQAADNAIARIKEIFVEWDKEK